MQSKETWIKARIERLERLSPKILRVVLRPEHWQPWLAGQHIDIRLTAPDGYQAQRSYSLLWSPEPRVYHVAIERLDDGEVSGYFHGAALVGDELEVLGPVGGYFVWDEANPVPALLIGGGSGLIPLLSMAARRSANGVTIPMVLVVGARRIDDVILWKEIQAWEEAATGFNSYLALSRETQVPRPQDQSGRIDAGLLGKCLSQLGSSPVDRLCYVCGRNEFVEFITSALQILGVEPGLVRTERFGG
ncbi:MAG: hypothetical protein K2X35_09970 [Bryobacteraceae bacterium]|nr:hypothetical protein [Bryobacteraceae bacterium]